MDAVPSGSHLAISQIAGVSGGRGCVTVQRASRGPCRGPDARRGLPVFRGLGAHRSRRRSGARGGRSETREVGSGRNLAINPRVERKPEARAEVASRDVAPGRRCMATAWSAAPCFAWCPVALLTTRDRVVSGGARQHARLLSRCAGVRARRRTKAAALFRMRSWRNCTWNTEVRCSRNRSESVHLRVPGNNRVCKCTAS